VNATKRNRVGAIIFFEEKIISMYREFESRVFYTFPGGGMEENETEEECICREVFEEFGIMVKPIKKVYVYENARSVEHFYICEWISGEFGTGAGEEFEANRNKGIYKPVFIEISKISALPLMPPEVTSAFIEDYEKNGQDLRNNIKTIKSRD